MNTQTVCTILGALLLLAAGAAGSDFPTERDWYGTSVALSGGASALLLNPGGVGADEDVQLLLFEAEGRDETSGYRSVLLGMERLALGYEHIKRGGETGELRVVSLGQSMAWDGRGLNQMVRAPGLSTGMAFRYYQPEAGGGAFDYDIGALYRAGSWLSVGAVGKHMSKPRIAGEQLDRVWEAGIAIRPGSPRITFFADTWKDGGSDWEYRYGLEAEPFDGIHLRAWGNDRLFGAGIGLSLSHATIAPVQLTDDRQRGMGRGIQLTLSANRQPTVIDWRRHLSRIEIHGSLPDARSSRWGSKDPSLSQVLNALDLAARSRDIAGVLLVIGPLDGRQVLNARVQEVRTAIADLRRQGIRTVAYLPNGGGLQEYYLASAAEKVVLPELTTIWGLGSALHLRRYPGLLRKLGIDVDQLTAGAFKGTFQPTSEGASPEEQALIRGIVDDYYEMLTLAISDSRNLAQPVVEEAASGAILSPEEASGLGLIDAVGYEDTAANELRRLTGKEPSRSMVRGANLMIRRERDQRWRRPRIAVLVANGTIMPGRSRPASLLGGPVMGADTVCEQLRALGSDADIEAVVLRIDSGGGSAAASAQILNSIKELQAKGKPVVASMGRVAASGGYMIACSADKIVANPATLTGSIGVIGLRPSIARLLDKLGIKSEMYQHGDHMDILNLDEPLDDSDRELLLRMIGTTYGQFITAVADNRGMPRERVEELAGGRVFTGRQAHAAGLVDILGGLDAAVSEASQLAGLRVRPALTYIIPRTSLLNQLARDGVSSAIGLDRLAWEEFSEFWIW